MAPAVPKPGTVPSSDLLASPSGFALSHALLGVCAQRLRPTDVCAPTMPPAQQRTYSRAEFDGRHADKLLVAIDSQVYDLSRFVDAHPGGASVLTHSDVAGKDATAAFFGLHRPEILDKPAVQRLVVGTVEGEKRQHRARAAGALSIAPYAEPIWLSAGYASPPWFKDSHRRLQREMRFFFGVSRRFRLASPDNADTYIKAEAQELEVGAGQIRS